MDALIIIAIVLLCIAAIFLFLTFPSLARRKSTRRFVRDYAHRGLHGSDTPENTLEAFAKAADAGYGIELDVQLSSDSCVMVMHDYTTGRMCDRDVKISETSYAELKTLSIGGKHCIPTLREVLDTVGGRVPLLIELKGESGDTRLCEKLHAELNGYSGEYCVESFNPLLLRGFCKYEKNVVRGILCCDMKNERGILGAVLSGLLLNFLCRPDFIAFRHTDRKPLALCLCNLIGTPMFLWTPRGSAEYDRARSRTSAIIFEK